MICSVLWWFNLYRTFAVEILYKCSSALVSLACYDRCIKGYLNGVEGSVANSNLREAFPNTKTSLSASSLPTGSAGRRGSRTEKRIQLAQLDYSPGARRHMARCRSSISFRTSLHQFMAEMGRMAFKIY